MSTPAFWRLPKVKLRPRKKERELATLEYTTDYAGKALKTPRFDQDDILILPEARSELQSGRRVAVFGARKVRDIQARYNVSDEVARAIVSNRRLLEKMG